MMIWFDETGSNIAQAIQQAKSKATIFVVFIHKDEEQQSRQMEDLINQVDLSNFVCIKIEAASDACKQFTQIYPVLVVPAVYFITPDGVAVEVAGGVVTEDVFKAKVENAASAIGGRTDAERPSGEAVAIQSAEASVCVDDKVNRAKVLLEEIRMKKMQEAQEKEIADELARRDVGKNVALLVQKQKALERKQIQAEIRQSKVEEKEAREKVKQQIAQDRADKSARSLRERLDRQKSKEKSLLDQKNVVEAEVKQSGSLSRLQYRMADGSCRTLQFDADVAFHVARTAITEACGMSNIRITQVYPRRSFDPVDDQRTLRDLGLCPNATLLVMEGPSVSRTVSGAVYKTSHDVSNFLWTLIVLPVVQMFNSLYGFVFGGMAAFRSGNPSSGSSGRSGHASASGSSQSTVRRRQGVHRLNDVQGDDDKNKFWNGNSTQVDGSDKKL